MSEIPRSKTDPRFLGDIGQWKCECMVMNHELRKHCRICDKPRYPKKAGPVTKPCDEIEQSLNDYERQQLTKPCDEIEQSLNDYERQQLEFTRMRVDVGSIVYTLAMQWDRQHETYYVRED